MRKPSKKELKLQLFLKAKTICCVSMPVCLHVRMQQGKKCLMVNFMGPALKGPFKIISVPGCEMK